MSRKNRKSQVSSPSQPSVIALAHEDEYTVIKFDLIKVIVLNAVYLVVILALYFANQKSHVLDNWFAKLLHF